MERIIKRGDIYYAELNPVIGSEQGGTRPVLIISNDIGNKHSPTVIIAASVRTRGLNCLCLKRMTAQISFRDKMVFRHSPRRAL